MAQDESTREDTLAPPPTEGGAISGIVTDFDGVPLIGVRVEAATSGGADLDLLPVMSDGDGGFRLEGLATGRYDLRFVLGQVKARTLAVPVGTDQLCVRLARPQGIVLVSRTEPGLEPPPIVSFVLERHVGDGLKREHYGRTVKRRLLLWSIRPGRYTLSVWGGPYLPIRVQGVSVLEKQPAPEVEVVFSATGGVVEGHVRAAGAPVRALISWRRVDGSTHVPRHMTSQETDPAGHFSLRGFPTGRYRISAWHERHGIADVELDLAEDDRAEVALELPA